MNSMAVLACVAALDGDLALAALDLAALKAPKGRGERHTVDVGGRRFTLIDESYNANPASMQAAFATLARAETGKRGRRIAVLGDMLELGADAPALHGGLALPLLQANVDLLFACGPLMRTLFDAVPVDRQGLYAAAADALVAPLVNAIRDGDVVMVKGSLGSRMGPIVDALLGLADDAGERTQSTTGSG